METIRTYKHAHVHLQACIFFFLMHFIPLLQNPSICAPILQNTAFIQRTDNKNSQSDPKSHRHIADALTWLTLYYQDMEAKLS